MTCPACNHENPESSAFCNRCGTKLPEAPPVKAIEWEYRDYTWEWPKKERGYVSANRHTGLSARHVFWPNCQQRVSGELEEFAREGWQPVVDDLPGGVTLTSRKAIHLGTFGWIMYMMLVISTFGLAILFLPFLAGWYYEPSGYELELKRPRR